MDAFVGELRCFGFTFAPNGWAQCNGQLLAISQNTALFSLLGTTYGGDGRTTFGLPDLRGRVPIGAGQGPGLANYVQGEAAGSEQVTLIATQVPPHSHTVNASSSASSKSPADALPAATQAGSAYGTAPDLAMSAAMVTGGGSGAPHPNLQPYLVLNWCICLYGEYPPRQ